MNDFLNALATPENAFLRYALFVGLLSSVALGIVGSYVVTRRITYLAAAISHCVLGGIGAAMYLQKRWDQAWCDPMYGAAVAATLLAALLIGLVSPYARQREDTVISAVWAVGVAIGLLFLYMTPGYTDPMSYVLYGSIWMISATTFGSWRVWTPWWYCWGWASIRNSWRSVSTRSSPNCRVWVKSYYLLLLCLIALTVVLMVRIVGILLVIALLTLPAATAGHFARRLWQMMAVATLFCIVFIGSGITLSYTQEFPTGPVIVIIAGGAYLLVTLGSRVRRRAA